MTTETTTDSVAKKDTQKLQRSIVDGLEDVKAQDIKVFNTEHLSALFERVIIASGTSNRQTRALAASVRDAVREAGFPKPRVEGEENGEWIIVDCGQAVVHIMQPAIRQYYHLEELWGEKPIRLKFGTSKPALPQAEAAKPAAAGKTAGKTAGKSVATATGKSAAKPAVKAAGAKSKGGAAPAKRAAPRKPPEREIAPERPDMRQKVVARKVAAPAAPKPAAKAKPPASKASANKLPTAKKAVVLKTTVPAKKAPARAATRKA